MRVIEVQESYPREQMVDIRIPCPNFAYIISGVRRCGKSTLMGQLLLPRLESSIYVKFDMPRLYGFTIEQFRLLDNIIAEKKPEFLFSSDNISHFRHLKIHLQNSKKDIFYNYFSATKREKICFVAETDVNVIAIYSQSLSLNKIHNLRNFIYFLFLCK